MAFFTVILEYDGGTYIRQLESANVEEAILAWAENLDLKPIQGLGPSSKAFLLRDLALDFKDGCGPVALDGVVNVWCDSHRLRNKLALITLGQTVP
jgi:hypothetical protein